jgi:hypothetical protein
MLLWDRVDGISVLRRQERVVIDRAFLEPSDTRLSTLASEYHFILLL